MDMLNDGSQFLLEKQTQMGIFLNKICSYSFTKKDQDFRAFFTEKVGSAERSRVLQAHLAVGRAQRGP